MIPPDFGHFLALCSDHALPIAIMITHSEYVKDDNVHKMLCQRTRIESNRLVILNCPIVILKKYSLKHNMWISNINLSIY